MVFYFFGQWCYDNEINHTVFILLINQFLLVVTFVYIDLTDIEDENEHWPFFFMCMIVNSYILQLRFFREIVSESQITSLLSGHMLSNWLPFMRKWHLPLDNSVSFQ